MENTYIEKYKYKRTDTNVTKGLHFRIFYKVNHRTQRLSPPIPSLPLENAIFLDAIISSHKRIVISSAFFFFFFLLHAPPPPPPLTIIELNPGPITTVVCNSDRVPGMARPERIFHSFLSSIPIVIHPFRQREFSLRFN